ncbi:hypothetical protein J5751_04685 [bacterium]|nr:hypothetical protein [bacterium]
MFNLTIFNESICSFLKIGAPIISAMICLAYYCIRKETKKKWFWTAMLILQALETLALIFSFGIIAVKALMVSMIVVVVLGLYYTIFIEKA